MEVEFDVKIGFWNLYDFLLARTYLSFQGILGTIAGAFFIVEFCIEPRVIFLVGEVNG